MFPGCGQPVPPAELESSDRPEKAANGILEDPSTFFFFFSTFNVDKLASRASLN